MSSAVFSVILKNSAGNSMLLHLWHINPSMLLRGFADALNADQENVNRVLDACLELKVGFCLQSILLSRLPNLLQLDEKLVACFV